MNLVGTSKFKFKNLTNRFDFFVVLASSLDIILTLLNISISNSGSLLKLLRLFRIVRTLKLIKSMKGLQQLVQTLIFSLPSLMNVSALLFLVYFLFSILACFLFADIKYLKNRGQNVLSQL